MIFLLINKKLKLLYKRIKGYWEIATRKYIIMAEEVL